MTTTMRAAHGTETIDGWCAQLESGQRIFFANPSIGMRENVAKRYKVEWIRGYVIEGNVRVVLA